MSVSLYPGIKRLHLLYSTRYDAIRTQDVRDDLLGIKVWYSTTPNFNHTTTTPIDFGVGSSISLDNLQANTIYYVKYAFISRIDPTVYTVSSELSAKTYDEFTSVYGELTNAPHYLETLTGTTTPDWQYATGVFRVWNISEEVTGAGPVYSIVPNSATNGLQVTINATTGAFTATGWTGSANTAKVTFKAVYNGIEVFRDWTVINAAGQTAPQIRLVLQPANFVYRDATAVLSSVPQVSVTANLTNLTGTAVFTIKAYRADGTEITTSAINYSQVGNTITITNSDFHISNDIAYATVKAAIGTVYDQDTIYRLNNGTDQITVDVSNPVVQLQASNTGVVATSEYLDSGTTIEVYEGATKLFVDNSAPYSNGSWTITNISATGIVAEDQPVYGVYSITFPAHANMTQDTATIEYTVQYKTSAGFVGTRVVKQTLAKSKEGQDGLTGPRTTQVYLYARNDSKLTPPAFAPSTPLTYDFTTGLLSATIANWSQSIPNTTEGSVLWIRQAAAVSDAGGSVSINALAWSPASIFVSDGSPGDSIDIVFQRSATQPATPAASTGTPSGWYTDVNSVPASTDPMWSSVGTKSSSGLVYNWNTPLLIEGSDGSDGLSVAELIIYKRSATALTTAPTGGSYNFATRTLVLPTDGGTSWSSAIPSGTDPIYTSRTVASIQGISGTDTTLTWSTPVLSIKNGDNGTNGINTAIVYAYKRSLVAPTDNPGTVDYSFTSNTITTNTLANNWQKVIPGGTDPLYVVAATAASTTNSDPIGSNEWSSPVLLAKNGTNGINTATILLYARNNSVATPPNLNRTGTTTYTFSSGVITGYPVDWNPIIPPEASGTVIWAIQATATSTETEDTISNTEWSTPRILSQKGDTGAPGINTAVIYAYKRSTLLPTNNPGTVEYSFTTNTITTDPLANDWQKTIPEGDNPLYVVIATAASPTTTDTINSNEWSTPTLLVKNGTDGTDAVNAATVFLYARNASTTTAPILNRGSSSIYTFATGVLSGDVPAGWSTAIPAEATGTTIWVIQATAVSGALTDIIPNTEWSTPRILGQKGEPGTPGAPAQTVYINGFTGFSVSTGGAFTPSTASLTAVTTNISSPVYSWTISGGILSSNNTASVAITPNSGATSITVTVSVTGSDMAVAKTATVVLPIAQQGGPGQGGANGMMSAFPSIYQWTSSSTAPSTAGLPASIYTWATGNYAAPSGWSTTPPTNTTQGQYLWEVTIPLVVVATTETSTLNWAGLTARSIAYNGINGTPGAPGGPGPTGAAGSATFLITRIANDSSIPTSAELTAAIGRDTPQAGDIATINYNSGNASIVYRYTTSWIQQSAYITGSLIVQNSISGDRITTNTLTADKIDARGLSIKDTAGNVILQAGATVAASVLNLPATINNTPSGWQNSNISLSSNGYLQGGGGGNVTLSGLGAGSLATKSSVNWNTDIINIPGFGGFAFIDTITQANISSYFAGSAIGTAYIADGNITSAKIGNILQSSNWNGTADTTGNIITNGTLGWAISKSGAVVINSLTARGELTAASVFATGSGYFEGNTSAEGYTAAVIAKGNNRRAFTAFTTGNYEAAVFATSYAAGYTAQFLNTSTTGKGIAVSVLNGNEAIVAQGGLYGIYSTANKAGGYAGYFSGSGGAGGVYANGIYCAGNLTVTGSISGITSSTITTALGYTPGTSSFSGSYNDLTNKPTIPTTTSQLTNNSGYITGITSSMVTSALGYTPGTSSFSGSYTDLTNKPTIPTATSQLSNDSGYITGITSSMVTSALGYTPYNPGANTVITSANYSSYSPTLSGGGATGTWGISITGNAETVTNAFKFRLATPASNIDSATSDGTYLIGNFTDTHTLFALNAGGSLGPIQLLWQPSGALQFRNKASNTTWTAWRDVITNLNIGSQSVSYAASAGSVAWANITSKPSFFSGSYNDLTNKPTIPTTTSQLTNNSGYITGITSSMVTSALGYTPGTSSFSGSYTDLTNKPTIPTATSQLSNDSGYITGITSSMVTSALGYTPYNPGANTVITSANIGSQSVSYSNTAGTAGSAITASSASSVPWAGITDKPSFFSGSYNDLTNKPTIPTTTSQLSNDSGFITGITSGMVTTALGYTPASGVGWVDNGGGFYLRTGSSGIALQNDTLIIQNSSVRPGSDANVYLGASYSRWEVVWAANGTIQTSDVRKKDILGATPLGLEFINKLEPISYRYKIGGNVTVGYDEDNKPILQPRAGQRIFYGFKAQQVKQVVDSLGVEDFGGWVLDEKDDPNSGQSLRYTEFIAPLVKAVQELSAQVVALQTRIAQLENS